MESYRNIYAKKNRNGYLLAVTKLKESGASCSPTDYGLYFIHFPMALPLSCYALEPLRARTNSGRLRIVFFILTALGFSLREQRAVAMLRRRELPAISTAGLNRQQFKQQGGWKFTWLRLAVIWSADFRPLHRRRGLRSSTQAEAYATFATFAAMLP